MEWTPSEIGDRTEAAVIAALVRAGKLVYRPFSASGRVDLLFEDEAGFHRVQCKTGRFESGVILFPACSYKRNERAGYKGQIDFFAVYCHEREEAYLVPVREVRQRAAHLRVRPTRNGQSKGIRWASDYLLG